MSRNSLKIKLIFTLMGFALSCVLITSYLLQYVVSKNIKSNILNKNQIISRMISDQIDIYLNDAKSTVATAANFSSEASGDLTEIKNEIFRIYDNFEYFDLIFYMDYDGKIVFSKPYNQDVGKMIHKDRKYYLEAVINDKVYISSLHISRILNEPHFIIAAPVYNKNGKVTGLIGAGIPLTNITNIVEKTQRNFNGKIWITDSEGVVAVHPDIKDIKQLIYIDNINAINDDETDFLSVLNQKEESIITYDIENKKYYGAITFVPNVNWMVVVEQNKEIIFLQIIQMREQLLKIIFGVVIGALLTGLIFAFKITKPIDTLVKKVKMLSYDFKIAEPIQIDYSSYDEIHALSSAFNDMSVKLKHNLSELEQSYVRENQLGQYLTNILKSVANGILVIDKDGRITIFNKSAESITGYESKQFIGNSINEFMDITNMNLRPMIKSALQDDIVVADVEINIKNSQDEEMLVSVDLSQVKDNKKNVVGVVILFKDLSRIKAIEEELRREDRIKTLGELSASIIHDIGNPLSGMSNLIEILKDSSLDRESENEILSLLEKEIKDLNILVIKFLEYSRSSKMEKRNTDISKLIEYLLQLLRIEIVSKKIKVNKTYTNEPIFIKIDERDIKQALLNILINSIHAIGEEGEINIRLIKEKEVLNIIISDNGMGIDKEKIDRIFNPFFTTKKDGTGLGLSIVYKAIKEHKGKIAVKSEPNIGTEFIISLPLED